MLGRRQVDRMNMTWTEYERATLEQEDAALGRWMVDLGVTVEAIKAGKYTLARLRYEGGRRVYELWTGGYEVGTLLGRLSVTYTPEMAGPVPEGKPGSTVN